MVGEETQITLKRRLDSIGQLWNAIREFFYEYKTIFDLTFHALYAIEPLGMVILLWIFSKLKLGEEFVVLIASIFMALILFTRGVEKICMDSRYARYHKEKNIMQNEYSRLECLHTQLNSFIKTKLFIPQFSAKKK